MTSIFDDDPFGPIKEEKKGVGPEPREVALMHNRSDVDASTLAQHHTLGVKHTQSAPGDHVHDGTSSRKIGTGLTLSITGSKGGNAALGSLITMLKSVIDFTDNSS